MELITATLSLIAFVASVIAMTAWLHARSERHEQRWKREHAAKPSIAMAQPDPRPTPGNTVATVR